MTLREVLRRRSIAKGFSGSPSPQGYDVLIRSFSFDVKDQEFQIDWERLPTDEITEDYGEEMAEWIEEGVFTRDDIYKLDLKSKARTESGTSYVVLYYTPTPLKAELEITRDQISLKGVR